MNSTTHRIAIIGGGPAGTSCAIALSNLGFTDLCIIESSDYSKFCIGESIPPESKPLLKQLGIYDDFIEEAHEPCYGSCSYWGSDKRGYNDTILSHHGHGWHLDRKKFNHFLALQAEKRGVQVFKNTTFVRSISSDRGEYTLFCENEDKNVVQILCDFVIDASGSRSVFTQLQNVRKIESEPLICLAAKFQLANNSEVSTLTHIEAQEYGWWYAARLPEDVLLVGLYSNSSSIKNLKINSLIAWEALLNKTPQTKKFITGAHLIDEKFKGYPAPSFHIEKPFGINWLAIGDAASCYDPITSRGIVKSIGDGLLAAKKMADYFNGNELALEEHSQSIVNNYKHYLHVRKHYYQLETRWPDSIFWKNYQ